MNSDILTGAVDLGGTTIKVGLFQGNRVLGTRQLPAQAKGTLAAKLGIVETTLRSLSASHGRLDGVAMAYPGLVDVKQNRVLSASGKFLDATELDLATWSRDTFGVPFLLENDSNAALFGEYRRGCCQGCDNTALFILGTGVGTAALMNGRLVRGVHYQAGVLGGHFKTGGGDTPCSCGKRGCLEAQVGSWCLDRLSGGQFDGFESLTTASRAGDAEARRLLDQITRQWARGLATLVHAYDPEVVVFSGGVLKGRDQFLDSLEQQVRHLCWTPWGQLEFRVSATPDQSVLLGLHALMEEKLT